MKGVRDKKRNMKEIMAGESDPTFFSSNNGNNTMICQERQPSRDTS